MTIKIAQLASYGINVGDNITIHRIRRAIERMYDGDITWVNVNLGDFLDKRNKLQYCKNRFRKISEENDILILGGGGLIEANSRLGTGQKVPINEEVLSLIDIPIIIFSVGINYFNRKAELEKPAIEDLKKLFQKSVLKSVRNDGTYEICQEMGLDNNLYEIPDPGLIFDAEEEIERKNTITTGFLQPAWNTNPEILTGRVYTKRNLLLLNNVVKENNLTAIPHTPKDYEAAKYYGHDYKYPWTKEVFMGMADYRNFLYIVDFYKNYDYSIPLRGHGQLISIGINLPSIYLSTQRKVRDFSLKNGFEDYDVSIFEDKWYDNLISKIQRLKNDPTYLNEWYSIRNRNRKEYHKKYNDFCSKAVEVIKNAKR